MLKSMKPPIVVRPLTEEERHHLEGGLRSKHALTLRRCQIFLASAQRHTPAQIAPHVGWSVQTAQEKTTSLFHGTQPPWGGDSVAVEFVALYTQRQSRRQFMAPGAAFFQFADGKIRRLRLYISNGETAEVFR